MSNPPWVMIVPWWPQKKDLNGLPVSGGKVACWKAYKLLAARITAVSTFASACLSIPHFFASWSNPPADSGLLPYIYVRILPWAPSLCFDSFLNFVSNVSPTSASAFLTSHRAIALPECCNYQFKSFLVQKWYHLVESSHKSVSLFWMSVYIYLQK